MHQKKDDIFVLVGLGELFFENYQSIILSLGKPPDFLFDNDQRKWGKEFFDKKCLSREEFLSLPRSSILVLTTRLADRIYSEFSNLGFENIKSFVFQRGESRISGLYDLGSAQTLRSSNQTSVRDLSGLWCYISGASRGVGFFIAKKLADRGVNLVVQAREQKSLEKLEVDLANTNVEIIKCTAEFTDNFSLQRHCAWLESKCPKLDFAFLNAGISLESAQGSFETGSVTGWTKTFKVNVFAPWQITQATLRGGKIKENGKIIFISSSISGRLNESGYACSKAALNKLAGDLARNCEKYNVDFCLVDPGWIATEMGGKNAPNDCESLFPGIVLSVLTNGSCNGSWISVQDYAGFSIEEALSRAYHIGDLKEV